MGSIHRTLHVPEKEFARLRACCDDDYKCTSNEGYEYDEEATFPGGIRMAVQVCRASRGEPCWAQGVLFDEHGNELGCTHATDDIISEFDIEYEGTNYCVELKTT